MIVEFRESFDKDISKLDKKLIFRVFNKIKLLKEIDSLGKMSGIKKLSGFDIFQGAKDPCCWGYL